MVVCVGLLSGGIYGSVEMEVDYDPLRYVREDTDPYNFVTEMNEYFPDDGERVEVGPWVGISSGEKHDSVPQDSSDFLKFNLCQTL